MKLDLSVMPWSRFGNWLNLARPVHHSQQPFGPALYLRSNHCRPFIKRSLAALELFDGTNTVPQHETTTPHLLTIHATRQPARFVEAIMPDQDTVRLRGTGIGLRLRVQTGEHVVAHPAGPDLWTLNIRTALRRYQVQRLHGRVTLDAPWKREQCDAITVTVLPGADGTWEIALDEFWSSWQPRERRSFDASAAAVRREFDSFRAAFPPPAKPWRASAELAAYLLWACTKSPAGNLRRPATFMSMNWMDQVWSWDNCFNAAAFAAGHPDLALDQFLVVADHQDEFGAFPDAVNDGYKHYNFSKPPVQGLLLDWIRAHAPGFWTKANVRALYPSLAKFTLWWSKFRRDPQQSLSHYLHGNDSGWDNSTMFDHGVPLIAPDLNAFLVAQCRTLADMATLLGKRRDAQRWLATARDLQKDLIAELWRGDQFVARRALDGAEVKCDSLVPCMPIVLGRHLPEPIRRALVKRIKRFVTPHGLATELPTSPQYESDGYWRGPIWGPTTMLVCLGLEAAGERKLAGTIARRYLKTCARSGFAENFDALTGAPLRDRAYTWTASAFLCLAQQ